MRRHVNRGFVATLIVVVIAAELALRAAAAAPPHVVRVLYGTTLAMYMEVDKRLRDAAPNVQFLAMGDSLTLTQFQPDVFAQDRGLPINAVFNASFLALTFRSQEALLRHVGIERFARLRQVLLFVNPRRLTPEGNVDADVFRIVIPDAERAWRQAWRERRVAPLFDYSRVYGLSRYLVGASWSQIGRPTTWDEVEYLSPYGGVAFEGARQGPAPQGYAYDRIAHVSERYVADLKRVVEIFRSRGIAVVLLPAAHHPKANPLVDAAAEQRFESRMQSLARETGSVWVPLPDGFVPPSDTDFLDYGHLNRTGGVAFTHWLQSLIPNP
jgi:hypothetical protein